MTDVARDRAPTAAPIDFPALEDGYCVAPLLEPDAVAALQEVFDRLDVPADSPRFLSTVHCERDVAAEVDAILRAELGPRIQALIGDYDPFFSTFIYKGSEVGELIELHQDWTYTDERVHRVATAWIPLVDVDEHNGAMRVIPGSHTWTGAIRVSNAVDRSEPTSAHQAVFEEMSVQLSMAAGEVLLYDPALVHGSPPNRSAVGRVAVGVALVPRGAPLVHFRRDEHGAVSGFVVDDQAFYMDAHLGHHTGVAPLEPWAPAITEADFVPHLRPAAPAPDPTLDPAPAAAAAPEPAGAAALDASTVVHQLTEVVDKVRTGVRRARGSRAPEEAPVLRDPELDRRLRRDGFVRMPLLDPAAAMALRAAYGDLHGWEGDGFEVDFWNPDAGYRHAASAAIAAVVDDPLRSLFCAHEPFLRNFLVKWPGVREPDGFPEGPHRDWMYTNERAGVKSWVAWIALDDVTGHNGQLQVARGSHHIDDRLRGTNISTPWLDHAEVWGPRMLTVPAARGEVIVTDAATVHGSLSNLSDDPRVAVAVAIRPQGAPLVHYRQVDERRAARFEVDEEFFLTQPAAELLAGPPDLPIAAIEPIGGLDLTADELAHRLDRQPLAVLDRLQGRFRRLRPAP